jgi:hypothetical protein
MSQLFKRIDVIDCIKLAVRKVMEKGLAEPRQMKISKYSSGLTHSLCIIREAVAGLFFIYWWSFSNQAKTNLDQLKGKSKAGAEKLCLGRTKTGAYEERLELAHTPGVDNASSR